MPIKPQTRKTPTLLIFEDEPDQLADFIRCYTARGYQVVPVLMAHPESGTIAIARAMAQRDPALAAVGLGERYANTMQDVEMQVRAAQPDVLLTDGAMFMGGSSVVDGEMVVKAAHSIQPTLPMVVHSSRYDDNPPTAAYIQSLHRDVFRPFGKQDRDGIHTYFKEKLGKKQLPCMIRDAVESDKPAIEALFRSEAREARAEGRKPALGSYEPAMMSDYIQRTQQGCPRHQLLVAEYRGQIVGFIMANHRVMGDYTALHRWAVDETVRDMGVGRALFKAIKERSDQLGKRFIEVKLPEGNPLAVYQRLGFEHAGHEAAVDERHRNKDILRLPGSQRQTERGL